MEQQLNHIESTEIEASSGPAAPGLLRIAFRRKSLVALGLVGGLVVGALYYVQRTPVYQSAAEVLVIKKRQDALPVTGMDPRLSAFEDYLATHVALMRSPVIVERAIQKEGLAGLQSLAEEGNATRTVIKWLTVTRDRETGGTSNNIVKLSFRCSQPEECSKVLNAVINSYKDFLDEKYKNTSDETVKLITQARDVLQNKLGEKKAAYLEFRKNSPPILRNKEGFNLNFSRVTDVEAKRSALLLRRAEIEGRLQYVTKERASGRTLADLTAMIDEWTNRAGAERMGAAVSVRSVKELEEQLLPLLLEEETLKESYGADYPPLKSVRRRIVLARAMIARQSRDKKGREVGTKDSDESAQEVIQAYVDSLKQELDDTLTAEKTLGELFQRESSEANKLATYEIQDANFKDEIAQIKQLYDGIIKRLEEVGFTKDYGDYDAQIIAPAGRGIKAEPKASLVFSLAGLLGLLSGLGLAYLAEVTDKSFRTPEEIRRRLGLPVVGHIPLFAADSEVLEGADAEPALHSSLCTVFRSKSAEAEAFRSVRTALYFSIRGEGHKVVQITSPSPGDGKTTLAANLAVSMAQSGKRVLLVDADFRKPWVHKKFGLSNQLGLSIALAGEIEVSQAIQESGIDGLWVIPCGPLPPNPAELLTSPRFKEVLDQLREQYDFVLVDTPPLLAVTDPAVVAPRVDGVLLTIRVSKNGRTQAERAKEILTTLDAKILGVVVNGLERKGSSMGYGYHDYSYGAAYGSQDGDAERHSRTLVRKKSGDLVCNGTGGHNSLNGAGDHAPPAR
jgi:capsular exopolysaccharide synthesis family protein